LTFSLGRRPRILVRRPWSTSSFLCSLGCGWLDRAALRLELKRWYVGTAILEGGVGDLPGVVEQLDIGAAAPKTLCPKYIETLCRVGDDVVLMLVVGVVWRSSFGGLASSYLLERSVFTSPIACTASSLRLWWEVISSWLGVCWVDSLYRF
jgi:hypothetical protein